MESAARRILTLIESANKRTLYVAETADYEMLRRLGAPALTISGDLFPLLKRRCEKHRVKLVVKSFPDIEAAALRAIKDRLPDYVTFVAKGSSIRMEIPKQSEYIEEAKRLRSLLEALTSFYEKHCFSVETSVKIRSRVVTFNLEKMFHGDKKEI